MGRKAKGKKRRAFTQHPGVKIIRRERGAGEVYLGRWRDPATGKWREQSLTNLGHTSHDQRVAWAVDKARELAELRPAPGTRREPITLSEAVRRYFRWLDTSPGRRRAGPIAHKTRVQYAAAIGEPAEAAEGTPPAPPKAGVFLRWARSNELLHTDRLTPTLLMDLQSHVCALKARRPAKGERAARGQFEYSDRPLSPTSINQTLRCIQAFLGWLRKRGHLSPALTSDVILDCLELVRVDRAPPTFLRQDQVLALLDAARRHDHGHRKDRPMGSERYTPVLPFLRACLLTGARFSELAGLTWAEVDLRAGEIRLNPARVKTRRGRTIHLDVTPTLWAELQTLKLQAGDSPKVYDLSRDTAERARERLVKAYGAPAFTWHDLRRTCGTFLSCAPGIYRAASAYSSAKRLGHSVKVAEARYVGQVKVDPLAGTLEEAYGLVPPGTHAAQLARLAAESATKGA